MHFESVIVKSTDPREAPQVDISLSHCEAQISIFHVLLLPPKICP